MDHMESAVAAPDHPVERISSAALEHEARLRAALTAHHAAVWRTLRRMGVRQDDIDDVVQEVFLVFARKLPQVPSGGERKFLLLTAINMGQHARRSHARRRESFEAKPADMLPADEAQDPERAAERRRALALLDAAIAKMPKDLALLIVLCDVEEITMAEAAEILRLPLGTVASRLRRARQLFRKLIDVAQDGHEHDGHEEEV
jgi:RNA polymerase sigma-70 factor (ECF subfamily)